MAKMKLSELSLLEAGRVRLAAETVEALYDSLDDKEAIYFLWAFIAGVLGAAKVPGDIGDFIKKAVDSALEELAKKPAGVVPS